MTQLFSLQVKNSILIHIIIILKKRSQEEDQQFSQRQRFANLLLLAHPMWGTHEIYCFILIYRKKKRLKLELIRLLFTLFDLNGILKEKTK